METISENGEVQPGENPASPNAPENSGHGSAHNLENPAPPLEPGAVNSTAIPVTAEQLISPRRPGRPKGSTVANGARKPTPKRNSAGKFIKADGSVNHALDPIEPPPPQFVSEIPGHEAPGSAPISPESAQPGASPENTPGAIPGAPVADYKATALFIVTMATGTAAGIIGPEWNPDSEAEKEGLVNAVAAYLETTGAPDIPPGMMLLIVVGVYSAKRINQPATQTFIQKVKLKAAKIGGWIKGRFSRKPRAAEVVPFPQEQKQ